MLQTNSNSVQIRWSLIKISRDSEFDDLPSNKFHYWLGRFWETGVLTCHLIIVSLSITAAIVLLAVTFTQEVWYEM
ncbi:hypothetical protein PM082_000134 [Marasmius tenuissimus]|nr:hypothetical protein PM082_000134 [Marasmius tenuissimus]